MQTNPQVDAYLAKAKRWRQEMESLRALALGCNLAEELKWGKPCYSLGGKNVVIIIGFKEYCGLAFFKGALLKDPKNLLVRPGGKSASPARARSPSSKPPCRPTSAKPSPWKNPARKSR